ncbi:putative leucine--tRNA ligase, mitochondrial [Larimichthys crocea]|uniref:Uncharacterized protein n=1 Tax=Larimichthys crocea TaxID=215358 RepID=A0ACD3QUG0_LARCR|nr:putative leucine--tRNA ligase, mitochondrial [Larimichthys crocea]
MSPTPPCLKKKELGETKKIWDNKNYAIQEVTSHFTEDFLLNAAISRLMGLTNTLSSATARVVQHSVEFEESLAALVMMTAPMAPHLASELWAGLCQVKNPLSPLLQRGGDVLQQSWPTVDPEYLDVPDFVELSVLINNKALWESDGASAGVQRFRAGAATNPGEPFRTEASWRAQHQESHPIPQDRSHQLPR